MRKINTIRGTKTTAGGADEPEEADPLLYTSEGYWPVSGVVRAAAVAGDLHRIARKRHETPSRCSA